MIHPQRIGSLAALLILGTVPAAWIAHAVDPSSSAPAARYEIRAAHDPDGTGKFYLGREIAPVMGHEAVDWLERPEREREERTDLLIPALKLTPGDVVADIGCGSGYYTRRLAKAVDSRHRRRADDQTSAPNSQSLLTSPAANPGAGVVFAVDLQPEMLRILTNKLAGENLFNVRPVLGTATDPKLPRAAVDLILMVDVYHEFDHPFEMVQAMCASLKPGGRMVFVEFRAEDPDVPIKRVHKMSEAQVRKEMSVHPLQWVETISVLPWQHIIVFRKKA